MLDVLRLHVTGVRDDGRIAPQEIEAIALLDELRHHRDRAETAAAFRVVLPETLPAEPPGARLDDRSRERLRAADARAVVVVGEEDGGGDLQRLALDVRIEQPVRIDHVWTPRAQAPERPLEAKRRHRPRRRCRRNRETRLVARLLHFVQQGDLVSGSRQRRHQRTEVRSGSTKPTIAPVHDRDAHVGRQTFRLAWSRAPGCR